MKTNAGMFELQLELFLRMREKGQIVWTTRDKKEIPIKEMSDQHLINTIKMLERQQEEEMRAYDNEYADYSDLIGLHPNDLC